ncbi:MAG TPA: GNAT family N-acetyltransferase [Clostridia bacterium]
MIIKEYSDDNLEDLTLLMNQWFEDRKYTKCEIADSISMVRQKSENKVFVAENEEGRAVGYIMTGICYYLGFNPFVEVIQLLVDKDNRSRGIGESLIKYIEEYYKEEGIKEIKLHSMIQRVRAHEFYKRYGFSEFKQSKFFEKRII